MAWLVTLMMVLCTCHFATAAAAENRPSQPGLTSLTKELLQMAREPEFLGWLRSIRRRIHEDPELAFQEFNTSQLVAETGVVGSVGSGSQPWFGLRANMDAVPFRFVKSNDGGVPASTRILIRYDNHLGIEEVDLRGVGRGRRTRRIRRRRRRRRRRRDERC
ncbi:unnamed protein product [Linum trigynum]|uniref:Uncharacterized protein n=1 Tax=Linum trigynum TaxID=586398 RepID=A0AAV2E6S3_9ROSI